MRGRKKEMTDAKLTAFRITVGLKKELKKLSVKQHIAFSKLVRGAVEDFFLRHTPDDSWNYGWSEVWVAPKSDKQENLVYVSIFLPEILLKQSRHFALDKNISLGGFIRGILKVYAQSH